MSSTQALVRNVRTSLWMQREMTSGKHHEEEYRCRARGGAARNSEESLVMREERRGGVVRSSKVANPQAGMSNRTSTKPYVIAKRAVWEAYQQVKANRGAAGVDEETIAMFEQNLSKNLYKLWNRMSSGSYFPPPVKQVGIPKAKGGMRKLGIPTVSDRSEEHTSELQSPCN